MSYEPIHSTRSHRRSVKSRHAVPAVAAAVVAVLLGSSAAFASTSDTGFGFIAPNISGASGAVFLTGGGVFDSTTGFVHSGGAFRCTSTVSSGPLAGCMAGQGVRWDTASLLRSTPFKCTATDPSGVKTATTSQRHRRIAGRLLPSRRREPRVVHRQRDRLDPRHRSRCSGYPECLGARGGLWVRTGALQPLRIPASPASQSSPGAPAFAAMAGVWRDHLVHGLAAAVSMSQINNRRRLGWALSEVSAQSAPSEVFEPPTF